MLRSVAYWQLVRAFAIPVFRRINLGEIRIRHHWTGDALILHSFKHKGYWFHGKRRERRALESVGRLLCRGDTALDIGGHIGYMALYFGHLVGPAGRVYTFEPGVNNLPYIRQNVRMCMYGNITLSEQAIGRTEGSAPLWIEDLTGQNNSMIQGYGVFAANVKSAHIKSKVQVTQVSCVALDTFVRRELLRPDFVKVDVEGAELDVLNGMHNTLVDVRPALLIELTHRHSEVLRVLSDAGYGLFDEDLRPIDDATHIEGNFFALPAERIDRNGIYTRPVAVKT